MTMPIPTRFSDDELAVIDRLGVPTSSLTISLGPLGASGRSSIGQALDALAYR
jgi:hypothetical protein